MIGSPAGKYWSKIERNEAGEIEWHPLAAHCADVGACAEALLQRTLLRKRLAALGGRGDLTEQDVARLCVFAALHDAGKCNRGFQVIPKTVDPEVRRIRAGHVREFLTLLSIDRSFGSLYQEQQALRSVWPVDEFAEWADEDEGLTVLVAALAHHGRPVRCDEIPFSEIRDLWKDGTSNPVEGVASLVHWARTWFPLAFEDSRSRIPDATAFQHGFSGLVMLADWLGSDRRLFPYAQDEEDRMPFARVRAREAVKQIGLDTHDARMALGCDAPGFDRVSSYSPREAQQRVLSLPIPNKGGLTILESETGSGKTEAAIGRFVQLFHAGLVDGMFFALPTRTAATQIHVRVVEAIMRAFPDERSRPPVVLAVPGYLRFDDVTGRHLPGFQVLWADEKDAERRHRGWAAEQPKRFLAGSVVVGTIDQALLSSLRTGHAHLRATALLRHLLVVDEVHASDVYMNRILEHVLAFHVAAGGHAFLMSATLGSDTRARLHHAACVGVNAWHEGPSLSDALAMPYPVVHHAVRGDSIDVVAIRNAGLPKTVSTELVPIADDPQSVVSLALGAARQGARVLVLRNTVTDAVATQLALEDTCQQDEADLLFRVKGVITLHTARFSRADRVELDKAIESCLGKGGDSAKGCMVVATQTVQQSLDLDADLLITDLAPMDVLLQRMGRLHRHRDRDGIRPKLFATPRALVMTSASPLVEALDARGAASGMHGVGTVYDNVLILEATRRLLERNPEIEIPKQNRKLVELSTHPEALENLVNELGKHWTAHHTALLGKGAAHKSLASLNVVDRRCRFGEYQFKLEGIEERIAARLGESDRIAAFPEKLPGPFHEMIESLTIPGWLVRGAKNTEETPSVSFAGLGPNGQEIRFSFGESRLVYDRLGLRHDGPSNGSEDDLAGA